MGSQVDESKTLGTDFLRFSPLLKEGSVLPIRESVLFCKDAYSSGIRNPWHH